MHRKDVREPVSQLCVTAGNCTMAGRGYDPPSSPSQGGCRTSAAPAWVGFAQRFRKIHLAMAAESIDTNCMTLTRYWLHWNEIANVFVNKWHPHILSIQLFNLIYVLPSFLCAWTLLFLENHSNRLRFILAEQKKHAKGGTGERVKPIYYKVETTLSFEKYNSGEDLNGIEEEMIGLFACRHGPITIYFPHKLVSGNRFRALEALCW